MTLLLCVSFAGHGWCHFIGMAGHVIADPSVLVFSLGVRNGCQ